MKIIKSFPITQEYYENLLVKLFQTKEGLSTNEARQIKILAKKFGAPQIKINYVSSEIIYKFSYEDNRTK